MNTISTSSNQDNSTLYDQESSVMPDAYWIVDHEELLWSPGFLIKDVSEE